ncbi:hypothetical protein R3P38DRAFT_2760737 [Favolaschia claudopus]|uniref:Uncharacterized protein n=1 Tax=Favolaschia claudopus TaxID=2862362 RepID=A0AAW0DWM8_9AGAR
MHSLPLYPASSHRLRSNSSVVYALVSQQYVSPLALGIHSSIYFAATTAPPHLPALPTTHSPSGRVTSCRLQGLTSMVAYHSLSLDFMSALAAYIHTSSVLGWLVLDTAYEYLHNQDLTTDWNLEDVGREDLDAKVARSALLLLRTIRWARTIGPTEGIARFTLSGAHWFSSGFDIQATQAPRAFHDPIDAVETAASLSLHISKASSNADTRAAAAKSLADPRRKGGRGTDSISSPNCLFSSPELPHSAPSRSVNSLDTVFKATKPAARDSAQLRLSRAAFGSLSHQQRYRAERPIFAMLHGARHFSYRHIMPTERELIRAVVEIGMDLRELRKRRRRTTSMLDSERVHGNLEDNSSG